LSANKEGTVMVMAARDRMARTLRGDAKPAFSAELTARAEDLRLEVEGLGAVKFPVTPTGRASFSASGGRPRSAAARRR
jgi:hypothetical protein